MKKVGMIMMALMLCLTLTACKNVKKDIIGSWTYEYEDTVFGTATKTMTYTFDEDGTCTFYRVDRHGTNNGTGTYTVEKDGSIVVQISVNVEPTGEYENPYSYELNETLRTEYVGGKLTVTTDDGTRLSNK